MISRVSDFARRNACARGSVGPHAVRLWLLFLGVLRVGFEVTLPSARGHGVCEPIGVLSPLALLFGASAATAVPPERPVEPSAGLSMLVYLSPYAGTTGSAVDAALHGPIVGAWRWGLGARLGLGPARPEGFVRILAAPGVDRWEPMVGVELGVTGRSDFSQEDRVLSELTEASIRDLSPFYVAFQAMPLSFRFSERFRVSALEFQVGTHVTPMGRVVRLNLGLLMIGMNL